VSAGLLRHLSRHLLALCLCLLSWPALAHKPSDSYLALEVHGDTITGRWDIALRDLDFALRLDADGNGEITWGEVRARHADIAAYALARLDRAGRRRPCAATVGAQLVDDHTDGAYSVLPLVLRCPAFGRAGAAELAVAYTLFADLDPQHRGLLKLQAWGARGRPSWARRRRSRPSTWPR
jgi:hypothetical protein